MVTFEAYHGRTARQHQQAFDRLSAQGFRMISLSVYGDPDDARYNAVWVQRPGGSFLAFHGVRDADYQARFDQAVATGRAPVLVAATGAGSSAVFAAVFESGIGGPWMARHGLDIAGVEAANAQAVAGGMSLRSLTTYGSAASPRYAAVWHARRPGVRDRLRAHTPAPQYQTVFDAETTIPYARPSIVAVGEGHALAALFTNDVVGRWSARHGLTAPAYQQEFDRHVADGLLPICVDAGGTGAGARFAAIFAERDVPLARQWSAEGRLTTGLAGVEALVEAFMKRHAVRQAQLSVVHRAAVPLERAYTWSEPGTRRTRVRDRMLLASNSKLFVTAAVQWLYDADRLTPTQAAFPLLGFSGPRDARCDQITVQHLVDHRAGFANVPSDPTYDMRQIARDLGLSRAPTPLEVARRVYDTRNLATAPGTNYGYSNIGYLVAAAVVERVSGLSFFDFVRLRLSRPLGIVDVAPCPTDGPASRPANQAMPEDDGLGLTVLRPQNDAWVAAVFGGDGMAKESALGSCGLAASATALARFVGSHAVWGLGGRMPGRRDGSTPGCRSSAVSRTDGLDWALIVNTRVGIGDAEWSRLIDDIGTGLTAWVATRRRAGTPARRARPRAKAGSPARSRAR